ncbi:MAG: hypothetical protein JXB24_15210, partial [Bacteroidales bacterium]|nr:hypothetical protein [Bacteroidales bacterium]
MEGIRRTLQIVVFLAILLVTSLAAKGEESPTRYNREPGWKEYLRADRWARAMKYTGDPDSLARALTEPFDNIFLKYKTIYSWIAFNIAYDVPAYLGKSPRYNDPITVLDSQKTVCAGYAKLMCFLCKSVGLECEYVTGWAKNSVDEHLESIDEYPDHAWNAIYINEEWRYCDITWGAGSVLNNEKFIPGFTSAYFNMSAEKAFLQHFPQ